MIVIDLDAHDWCGPSDFYDALLAALGAPKWHGRNVNALFDSMIVGDINAVEAPYKIVVIGLDQANEDAADELVDSFATLARRGENRAQIGAKEAWLEIR